MVKHIVMFRLNGDKETVANLSAKFKRYIENLPSLLSALTYVEVGLNDGSAEGNWDIVLTAICKNFDDLAAYSTAKAHLDCVAIIKENIAERACVDYTV